MASMDNPQGEDKSLDGSNGEEAKLQSSDETLINAMTEEENEKKENGDNSQELFGTQDLTGTRDDTDDSDLEVLVSPEQPISEQNGAEMTEKSEQENSNGGRPHRDKKKTWTMYT